MEQKPLFMTTYAVARLLKEFALRIGLDEGMADVTAQVHMQQTSLPETWSNFITNNCAGCAKTPATCDYMNPQERNCLEGTTPQGVKTANAIAIEQNILSVCPAYMPG